MHVWYSKNKNKRIQTRRFSYAAAILWDAISKDRLNNSEHVDDLEKGQMTVIPINTYMYERTEKKQIEE